MVLVVQCPLADVRGGPFVGAGRRRDEELAAAWDAIHRRVGRRMLKATVGCARRSDRCTHDAEIHPLRVR